MKASLSFDLPEDKQGLEMCVRVFDAFGLISDLDQDLRGKIKYNETLSEETIEILKKIRQDIADSRLLEIDNYG